MNQDSVAAKGSGERVSRRRYLNEKPFQLTYIFYSLGIAAAVILSNYLGLYFLFHLSQGQAADLGLAGNPTFDLFIRHEMKATLLFLFSNAVIIMTFMGLFGLFFTHRVAGPLYRVKIHLTKLAEGEKVSALTFRKNDYFQELAETINKIGKRVEDKK